MAARERHGIDEPQSLDVVPVDAGEGREPLAVIGAVVHQPVLRLLVGLSRRSGVTSAASAGATASMLPASSAARE